MPAPSLYKYSLYKQNASSFQERVERVAKLWWEEKVHTQNYYLIGLQRFLGLIFS